MRNLSSYELSSREIDLVSKGLKFFIPPLKIKSEQVFSEFEILCSQLEHFTLHDNEIMAAC